MADYNQLVIRWSIIFVAIATATTTYSLMYGRQMNILEHIITTTTVHAIAAH